MLLRHPTSKSIRLRIISELADKASCANQRIRPSACITRTVSPGLALPGAIGKLEFGISEELEELDTGLGGGATGGLTLHLDLAEAASNGGWGFTSPTLPTEPRALGRDPPGHSATQAFQRDPGIPILPTTPGRPILPNFAWEPVYPGLGRATGFFCFRPVLRLGRLSSPDLPT